MKLIEIANRIDKSEKNEEWIDTEKIGNELELDVPYVDQDRLKCFWVGNWCCTDTWVGYRMYFLDDEPVAFSMQKARKSSEKFYWFGLEPAQKVKDYLLSLVLEKEDKLNIEICDIQQDMREGFKIFYSSQITNAEQITFHGEKVRIVERIEDKKYGSDKMVKIQLPNGETKEVDMKELDFKYHII